ncbi:DUF2125 domain-containing protein [Bosea sp. (in: a-proteobacteria)]|uniref:DUF2125 domain-containing protein n=1 Tax=Bosea sp. (in: a-proteobacteria) TaxID=1871050 RepID=UPI0027351EB8|nr:DUF2125 domain-containing protein [Bosea sp. (in: a-proteobacteria)]MDP3408637.1 DUF2125 domain-containing protein [Bosea sp. (in: a-proteobacteria)]
MTEPASSRSTRVWLYAPFVLLALVAAGWTGFWFVVRARVVDAVDTALAKEAGLGRSWTCTDRSVTGFPFRVELRCGTLALASARWGEAVRVQTGPAVAVGQIYTPNLVIAQITGPLQATLPEGRKLDLGWTRLEASLMHRSGDPERLSLVLTAPTASLTAPGLTPETWRATALEAHLRRNPTRPAADQAVDLAIATKGSVLPALDALLGTSEPGDVDIQATLTQTKAFRIGLNPDALEAWRISGGQIELTRLVSVKGPARIEATGQFLIDQTHRPAGQLQASLAGIRQIAGIPVGGIAAGLGGLLGGRLSAQLPGVAPGLTALPPIVLREGRAYLGPIRLPLQPLPALY